MQSSERAALAELLAAARREGRQVVPPALMPADAAEGYEVGGMVAGLLGWPRLGWKVAGTTEEMQRRLRVPEPIRGPVYARFITNSPAVLPFAELLDPLIECEVMFRLAAPLPPRAAPWTMDEVAAAVGSAHAGVEVAECRYPMDRLPAMPGILADGAASGRYVVGAELPGWRRDDFSALPVTLEVDGVLRRSGSVAEAMGHPLNVLLWLAEALRRRGEGLAEGALVSSGTCTGMLRPAAGQRLRARFGETAEVAIDLAA